MKENFYIYLEGAGYKPFSTLGKAMACCDDIGISHDAIGEGPDHPLGPDVFYRNFLAQYYGHQRKFR